MTMNDNNVAQHGQPSGHNSVNIKSCSLGLQHISLILDIHVIVDWHLSNQGICWPVSCDHIRGSGLELIKVMCLLSWSLTKCWFMIRSQAHVRSLCWNQGQIVQKRVNTKPGLKVNWSKILLVWKCFSLHFGSWAPGVVWNYSKSKQKAKQYKQNIPPQSYKTQIKILAFPKWA